METGSAGRGAFHAVDWGSATWGVGDLATSVIDLSGYTAVRVDARIRDLGGHSGTALFRFALDLPGGTEWSTSTVALTGSYVTYEFDLSTMTRTAGSEDLDLTAGMPKLIVERNGQTGAASFDFDEIVGVGMSGGPFVLDPVMLNSPPDGDFVRAIWLYAFANDLRVDDMAESQSILDHCGQEGVNQIYFHAYHIFNGTTQVRENLRTFLIAAHASGIRVDALFDGVNEFSTPTYVQNRIDEVLSFNADTPAVTLDDFDGIHIDMEFWLSTAWNAASTQNERRAVARDFLDNVPVNARNYLDAVGATAMPVGLDLSAHFDTSGMLPSVMTYNSVSQYFLEHVMDVTDEVVLMSYIDSASGLLTWTGFELGLAAGKGRTIQVAADMQPVPPEVSINSFADNFSPTPYAAMTVALEDFHGLLSASQLAALDGFSVFHLDGYRSLTPSPHNLADLDGDEDADAADFAKLVSYMGGAGVAVESVALDGDLDGNATVDMADLARFATCFTGADCGCPTPGGCER